MQCHLHLVSSLWLVAPLAAQGSSDAFNPTAVVARAETLLQNKETEFAIVVLWNAFEQLGPMPSDPPNDAARQAAMRLLSTHDPNNERRVAAFASIARHQVELAAQYRAKKWLEAAAGRVGLAAAFDRDVAATERAALEGPKRKSASAASSGAADKSQLPPLLRRANTEFIHGEWKEVANCLQCQAPAGGVAEWVCKEQHVDGEFVVEFVPSEPARDYHFHLLFGLAKDRAANQYLGYLAAVCFDAKTRQYGISLEVRGVVQKTLVSEWVTASPMPDGSHRFTLQLRGKHLRARLDAAKPVEVDTPSPARGFVGLFQGVTGAPSGGVQFRTLLIDPLPLLLPTAEELQEKGKPPSESEVKEMVTSAKDATAKKQSELAALRSYGARHRLLAMVPGEARDSLAKSIEQLIAQVDPLAPKRRKATEACAAELTALAAVYRNAGMTRAGDAIAERAARFGLEAPATK